MMHYSGTYGLLLQAQTEQLITIGRLGVMGVRPGWYVYVGSAFGPGGVKGRVGHHLRPQSKPHWHIDYLRQVAPLVEVWYTHDPIRHEHTWASLCQQLPDATIPLPRFGASDCTCPSHLFHFPTIPLFTIFQQKWQALEPDAAASLSLWPLPLSA